MISERRAVLRARANGSAGPDREVGASRLILCQPTLPDVHAQNDSACRLVVTSGRAKGGVCDDRRRSA